MKSDIEQLAEGLCRKHKSSDFGNSSVDAGFPKQERYKDADGKLDYIDECTVKFTPEEFRGAMKFTIGKYQSRLGKKDNIVQEVTKIADYANRWLQYEIKLENKNEGGG
jgi:hypothetical protein